MLGLNPEYCSVGNGKPRLAFKMISGNDVKRKLKQTQVEGRATTWEAEYVKGRNRLKQWKRKMRENIF